MNYEGNGKDIFFEHNPTAMLIYDPSTLSIVKVNEAACIQYGYSKQEMERLTIKDLRPEEEVPRMLKEVSKKIKAFNDAGIWIHKTKAGTPLHVKIMSYPIEWEGRMNKLVVIQNASEAVKTGHELMLSKSRLELANERFEMVIRATRDVVYDWDIPGDSLYWAENYKEVFGHSTDKSTSIQEWKRRVHPDDRETVFHSLQEALATPLQKEWQAKYRFKQARGTYAIILEKGFIKRDDGGQAIRMVGALQDITRLEEKEQEILESLREKEVLLSEIHHRVKNNLSILSGMLQLQIFEEEDQKVQRKLTDFMGRMHSLAKVQEHLYQSNNFSKLPFHIVVKALVEQITSGMFNKTTVKLDFQLEPVELNVNQAIPAAIIINEVVSDMTRHTSLGVEQAVITTELSKSGEKVTLRITNNGLAFRQGEEHRHSKQENRQESEGLGLSLIRELTRQLNGRHVQKTEDRQHRFHLEFEKSELGGAGNALL